MITFNHDWRDILRMSADEALWNELQTVVSSCLTQQKTDQAMESFNRQKEDLIEVAAKAFGIDSFSGESAERGAYLMELFRYYKDIWTPFPLQPLNENAPNNPPFISGELVDYIYLRCGEDRYFNSVMKDTGNRIYEVAARMLSDDFILCVIRERNDAPPDAEVYPSSSTLAMADSPEQKQRMLMALFRRDPRLLDYALGEIKNKFLPFK